jgi:hypothetical protein
MIGVTPVTHLHTGLEKTMRLEETMLATTAPVEVVREDGNDNVNTNDTNEYVRRILRSADLHILQPGLVSAAYNAPDWELSLFHLYLTRDYLNREFVNGPMKHFWLRVEQSAHPRSFIGTSV